MTEFVILVDSNDNQIGLEEKVKCHSLDGRLHRAFTALLFDDIGRLALARRDVSKMLWPSFWDGTFASHPREGETYVTSGQRRMPEELGVSTRLDYINKFEYHVQYKDVGSENEICGTLVGIVDEPSSLREVQGEIDCIRWVSADELLSEMIDSPEMYCPWMLIALELLDKTDDSLRSKYHDIMELWCSDLMHKRLDAAIKHHISSKDWRLVHE